MVYNENQTAVPVSREGANTGIRLQNVTLSRFERQVVTGNRCEALLDMKCVFNRDSTDIFYDTARLIRLDDVLGSGMADAETALTLCGSFLEAVGTCADYLLTTADLSFRNEHIFCSQDLSEVKFQYIPGFRNEMDIRDKLMDIIDTVIEFSEDEDERILFLSDYKNRLYMSRTDPRSLMAATEEVLRKRAPADISLRDGPGTGPEPGGGTRPLPADPGTGSVFREEHSVYGEKPKIGKKIRNLITELVS